MKSFSSSKLHKGIIKYLEDTGIHNPSEIQEKSIPLLLSHDGDFVGRSATGTGKTFAFGAPLLSRINTTSRTIQAVVLVPTRELCEQVGNELIALGKNISGLKTEAIYGGMPLKEQIHSISNGVHLIVATPGRLVDLLKRKVVDLSTLNFIVFDEADEMLLKGFRTDINHILEKSNRNYSTWLFSATMPNEINSIIKKYLNKKLKQVLLGKKELSNEGIEHCRIELSAEEKLSVLLHYLTQYQDQKGIIFCRTKSGVQKLYKQLSAKKFTCGAIHGDMPQGLRNKTMEQYREGQIDLLIATDVASRGVDVPDVAYVIQYHVPDTKDTYLHRSGRTSRAGKTGMSIMFSFPEEKEKLSLLEEELGIKIKTLSLPSIKDQLVNKAILWGRKIAKEKPIGDKLNEKNKKDFKKELNHLSKDELLDKLLATYLREQQS